MKMVPIKQFQKRLKKMSDTKLLHIYKNTPLPKGEHKNAIISEFEERFELDKTESD